MVPDEDGLLCYQFCGRRRVLVPNTLTEQMMPAVHGLHHLGNQAMRRLAMRYYVRKGISTDIIKYIKVCNSCVMSSVICSLNHAIGSCELWYISILEDTISNV